MKFAVLFTLVDVVLKSKISCGLIKLCRNIWFVSIVDEFGLFEFGELGELVGRLGVDIIRFVVVVYVSFAVFIFFNESAILVLVNILFVVCFCVLAFL